MPVLDALHETYGDRGLVVIGPTQLFGYATRGDPATPEQELDYLRNAYPGTASDSILDERARECRELSAVRG